MAFDLNSISKGAGLRAPRIILLGVEKIGKSTFAAGSDAPVFIPIRGEEGIDSIDASQFPTCNSIADVMSCLGTLYTEEHTHKTIVIDSGSALESLIWANVCLRCPDKHGDFPDSIEKVGGGWSKGYTEALTEWRTLTDALDALRSKKNMASIIIGHVKVKRFDDPIGPAYDQYRFDLNEKAANLLFRWSDLILFCNTKVVVKSEDVGFQKEKHRGVDITGGARYLYTQKRPAHPGGGRGVLGHLPYELDLSWDVFQHAVADAVAKN